MVDPFGLCFWHRLDLRELLRPHVGQAVRNPIDMLLHRGGHVRKDRGAQRSCDREEIRKSRDADSKIGARAFRPCITKAASLSALDVHGAAGNL